MNEKIIIIGAASEELAALATLLTLDGNHDMVVIHTDMKPVCPNMINIKGMVELRTPKIERDVIPGRYKPKHKTHPKRSKW